MNNLNLFKKINKVLFLAFVVCLQLFDKFITLSPKSVFSALHM